ncbi:MAG: hypothetical protein IKJ01_09845 [Lachnospiraceae bacterium]|nr:hypothetical protein [Lachnospiraceae bacterium]
MGETLSDDYLFAEVRQTWERVSNFKIPIICGLMGKEDVVLKYCNMNGEYELEYVPKYEIEGKFEYDCEFIYDRYRKFGAIYYYNVGKIKKVLLEKLIVYNNWKEDYESKQISQLFKTAYTTILAEGLETAEDINFKWNLNESQKIEEILHKVNYNEVQNRRFLVEMNLNLHK